MEISVWIKQVRTKMNMTQEDFAEELGVTRQTVSSWENGKSYPDILSIIKISNMSNISLDKMLKEDEKLVNNMKEQMDTVKSNKTVIFTILLATIVYAGIYLIQTFIDIPKFDNLLLNIVVMLAFGIGIIIFAWHNTNINEILNNKTSNKSILKAIVTIIMIITIIVTFPLLEKITTITWQILILRFGIILGLAAICLFIFKKIDKC